MEISVKELFAQECEHATKTHQCTECRYEVGVVLVPDDIIEQGLLEIEEAGVVDIDAPIELTGEIQVNDMRTVHMSTRVEGVIASTHVDMGQRVEESQVLFEIDSVELGEAEMAFVQAKSELGIAGKNHDRQLKLEKAGVTSEKEYLEAKQALAQARIDHDTARKKLLLLGMSAKDVKTIAKKVKGEKFGRLETRSPLAGTVIALHAPVGELLEPGDEVLTVSDLSSLWVWVDIYENDLGEVVEHQQSGDLRATVEVQAWPGEEFVGTVDLVGATMEEATRTVKARISIPNPDGRLRPGMFGQVRLYIPMGRGTLAVPDTAVQSDEGVDFVFVHVEGEYFVRRKVETGRRAGSHVEIVSGIEIGQSIVVKGAFLLKSDVLRSKMGAGCAD